MIAEKIKPTQPTTRMSFASFLEWADEDTSAEWVDGEVIVFMPAKDRHQTLVGFLYEIIALFIRLFPVGQVRLAPLGMKLASSAREPDILFVAEENAYRVTEDYIEGPADLVVEVISNDSVQRDREHKFHEYQAAGVREYWILDPRPGKNRADFFYLNEKNYYSLFATEDDEWVESKVIKGLSIQPEWLWEAKTLNPFTCALKINGVAEAIRQQLDNLS